MTRALVMAAAIIALAACSSMDRSALTEFSPSADGSFAYQAQTGAPEASGPDEAERLAWLERYLADNGMCGGGYEITSRMPVVISTNVFGGHLYRIDYRGRCT